MRCGLTTSIESRLERWIDQASSLLGNYSGILVCRDPKDQVFIDLALASKVDFLVTGDKDLHEYPPLEGLKIISPDSLRLLFG